MAPSLVDLYTDTLWWMMDRIGVTQSVERKVLAAVVILTVALRPIRDHGVSFRS